MKQLNKHEEEILEDNIVELYHLLELRNDVQNKISNMVQSMKIISMHEFIETITYADHHVLYDKLIQIIKNRLGVEKISVENLAQLLHVMHKSMPAESCEILVLQKAVLGTDKKVLL